MDCINWLISFANFEKKSLWDYIKIWHNIKKTFKLSVTDKTRDVSEQSMSRLWTNGKIARMQFKKS